MFILILVSSSFFKQATTIMPVVMAIITTQRMCNLVIAKQDTKNLFNTQMLKLAIGCHFLDWKLLVVVTLLIVVRMMAQQLLM